MSTHLAAGSSTGSPLWFLTRSSALVAFVLLTVTLLLGLLTIRRTGTRVPRFVSQALHRNATLLALGFVLVHVLTTVLDGYVPIGWQAAVVPFTSGYRTSWVAAGTAAFDLIVLLTVTSLIRARIGLRVWRAIHWLAYALWPLALAHYLGAGTDVGAAWGLWLAIVAGVAVAAAVVVRVMAAASAAGQAPARHPVRGAPVGPTAVQRGPVQRAPVQRAPVPPASMPRASVQRAPVPPASMPPASMPRASVQRASVREAGR